MSGRGSYRPIRTALIDGPDYQALTPRDRLVLLTLKLGLGPTGIDVFYAAVLEEQTGYGMIQISEALAELKASRWIRSERNVLWIVDGLGHEPSMKRSNQNHRDGVANHLNALPRLGIVDSFRAYYADWIDEPADTSHGITKACEDPSDSPQSNEGEIRNDKTEGVLPPPSPELDLPPGFDEATARVIGDFLTGLPPTQAVQRWRAEIAGWPQGLNLNVRGAPPETIRAAVGIGLADYLKRTDRDHSPRHVRSFVESALREVLRHQALPSKNGRKPRSRDARAVPHGATDLTTKYGRFLRRGGTS